MRTPFLELDIVDMVISKGAAGIVLPKRFFDETQDVALKDWYEIVKNNKIIEASELVKFEELVFLPDSWIKEVISILGSVRLMEGKFMNLKVTRKGNLVWFSDIRR